MRGGAQGEPEGTIPQVLYHCQIRVGLGDSSATMSFLSEYGLYIGLWIWLFFCYAFMLRGDHETMWMLIFYLVSFAVLAVFGWRSI